MDEAKLNAYLELYKKDLEENKRATNDLNDRQTKINYFKSIQENDILAFTREQVTDFIKQTWASKNARINDYYIVDTNGGLDVVKNSLVNLLFGKDSIEKRWDGCRLNKIGEGTMSELLSCYYPNDFAIFNGRTRQALFDLNIPYETGPRISGKGYVEVCQNMKMLKEKIVEKGIPCENLLGVDYFLWNVAAIYMTKNQANPTPETKAQKFVGENVIYYGVPGCGKSHLVQEKVGAGDNVFRTTFHLDYSYSDFVGQLLPIRQDKSVSYVFNPGPFCQAMKYALAHPNDPIYLIIEEINRGNAPAIFGDVFQLLDRNGEGASCYPIRNDQIAAFLLGKDDASSLSEGEKQIRIPSNLFIYCTMNTSDQSVFPLDTAFKRRFGFVRVSNDFEDSDLIGKKYVPNSEMTWEDFVDQVNFQIRSDQSGSFFTEDKQIGKYFVDASLLCDSANAGTDDQKEKFAMKVLEYLWDDVAKGDLKNKWFGDCQTLDEVIDNYLNNGIREALRPLSQDNSQVSH
jgi:hypothetical protein